MDFNSPQSDDKAVEGSKASCTDKSHCETPLKCAQTDCLGLGHNGPKLCTLSEPGLSDSPVSVECVQTQCNMTFVDLDGRRNSHLIDLIHKNIPRCVSSETCMYLGLFCLGVLRVCVWVWGYTYTPVHLGLCVRFVGGPPLTFARFPYLLPQTAFGMSQNTKLLK